MESAGWSSAINSYHSAQDKMNLIIENLMNHGEHTVGDENAIETPNLFSYDSK